MRQAITPLVLIGGGHMAEHMLAGWQNAEQALNHITVVDKHPDKLAHLYERFGVQTSLDASAALAHADTAILAVKPQSLADLAADCQQALRHQLLLISIAAGVPVAELTHCFGAGLTIVRAMPNIIVARSQGNTVLHSAVPLSASLQTQLTHLFKHLGAVQWLEDESLFDAYTVLSGSGPAYIFLLMEHMITAAESIGINLQDAQQITEQLFLGATQLAMNSEHDLTTLREHVTSKKGVTEQVVATLQAGDLEQLFQQAFAAGLTRAQSLQLKHSS